MLLRDIWDLFNLGQFALINQMIPLTVITLRGAHHTTLKKDTLVEPGCNYSKGSLKY